MCGLLQRIIIQRQRNVIRGHKEVVALQNKDIVDSIHYAKRIQNSVLPSQKQFRDVFPDSFILYNPKDIISGDFYWLYEAGDTVYFSVSDCPGRGVPGAFMSIIGSSLLNDAISSKGLSQPSEILDEVKNEYVRALELSAENTLSGDDMKAVLCAWDKNGAMQYAAANMSLLIIRDGQVIETHSDNRGIGFSLGPPLPFTNHSISLKKRRYIIYVFRWLPEPIWRRERQEIQGQETKELIGWQLWRTYGKTAAYIGGNHRELAWFNGASR